MRIGLDIDNVVLDTFQSFLNYYNQRCNQNFSISQITSYNVWEVGIGKNREEAIKFMDDFFGSIKIPFVEGAENGIREFEDGDEVYFISARYKSHRKNAEEFVSRNFPNLVDRLIFTNDFSGDKGRTKAEVCSNLGVDCYVEDHYDYLLPFEKTGIKSLLLKWPWNEAEWNRLKREERGLIIPVENWDEILIEIKNLSC